MKEPQKILIVRTDRIGDVVLTLPLAEIIKRHLPHPQIAFLLRDYTSPLAQGNPFIDEIITLPEKNGEISFSKALPVLKRKKFDAALIVSPKFKIASLIFLAGIEMRIGTGYRWYSFLFNKKIYEHRRRGDKHELEYNVKMLEALGIEETVSKESVVFNVHPNAESKRKVRKILKSKGWDENLKTVIIHPGSGKSAVDLPLYKFKNLISLLARELKVNLILTGNGKEKKMCNDLMASDNVINTAGKFALKELIGLISLSDLLVANSTGPIHIAAALGKKTIGFYPNVNECSPRRWGPYSTNSFVFVPETDCVSCEPRSVNEKNCMESIPVEKVALKIKEMLNG